ncbi:ABC transporter substrate-binding protein [Rhodospirillaceae bacterium SYSU D60014]|uniref:ABC transporter substrate-binding protein n=1 Tax=Virgifigura deserti TaxID=2268457 RepID=UPI000E670071
MTPQHRARHLLIAIALSCLALAATPAAAETVRVGILKFGTVSWELDVIKTHGLDKAEGIDVEVVELAGKDATAVALQAGKVDVIVTDWIWVSRQRAAGADFTFVPYSTAVGALMVPAESPIRTLSDLKGKRLGIAGGPADKSWLLIRALARERHGMDLAGEVDAVFGAPPLLNEQIRLGRIDAIINYWNYLAPLEAKGFRTVISVEAAARELGIGSDLPLLGYVFDESWGEAHRDAVSALVRASRKAKRILEQSEAEWERLRPMMGASDEATFRALRDSFRQGIPESWGNAERADAARAFALMAELGGEELVGKSRELQAGTFWQHVTY